MASDDPDTLVGTDAGSEPGSDVGSEPGRGVGEHTRIVNLGAYVFGDVIGTGGVGEVVIVRDQRMGRDVALKRLKTTQPSDTEAARFLREAKIQARLEHPSIVPVYEMGRDVDGRLYFTMKRVTGATLGQVLPSEPAGSQRLLRAFADVCLAVEFAHTRGISHRDLKPSNIMLGDFGEVYVLDWGTAADDAADAAAPPSRTAHGSIAPPDGNTAAQRPSAAALAAAARISSPVVAAEPADPSRVFGTPGYCAPEQLRRGVAIGAAADVYALGAILFELVTRLPLHPRASDAAIESTLSPATIVSPALRSSLPVPPELDALCIAALSLDPTARPTARLLAERIQAFLDGDRDLARRRAVATEHLWAARSAFEQNRRADAMREAGRAIALDPACTGAAELLTALMLEPPRDNPAALDAALRDAEADGVRRHARSSVIAYLAIACFLPVAAWNGVRRWDVVLGVFALVLVMAGAAFALRRRPARSLAEMVVYAAGNAVLLGMMTRMVGPFTFVPALACVIAMSSVTYPAFLARPWILIAVILCGFVVPIALERAGVLAMTWELRDGGLLSHAGALDVGAHAMTLVIVASLATITIAGVHAARIARASQRAQQALVTQAWHLRQLLP
ncbi:MAG TPA: serine/threonine-protein kinase [Kofleriaceae bacterium]